jgi:hypothetical protein
VGISFHLLTKGATLNVFPDIGAKIGPPKVSFNKFFGFKSAGMTCSGVVMETSEQVMASSRGDIGMIFVIQDPVNNLPVRQCRFHRGKAKAIQGVRCSGEDGVRGGVIRRQGIT